MGSPYAPPVLYGHRPNASIRDLMLMQGQERARYAQQSGDIWSNAIQSIGQVAGGAFQAYGQQKEEKKQKEQLRAQEAKMMETIRGYDPSDPDGPSKLLSGLTSVMGPREGVKTAEAVLSFHKQTQNQPKEELEGFSRGLDWLSKQSDPVASEVWPIFRKRYAGTAQKLEIQDPGEAWDPSFRERIAPVAGLLGAVSGQLPPTAKKLIEVSPNATLYDQETNAGVFTAPGAPEKPKPTLEEITAEARARAMGTASVKPPATEHVQKIDVFNPETGENETRFITNEEALAMAKGGKPGLSKGPSAATKNRMDAARTSIQAGEALISELKSPEFSSQIGPVIGRYNSLTAAAGAGDPKAQYIVGAIRSFSALQPQIHGFRAVRFAEDIEKLLSTKQTPEALAAGLKGILTASYLVAKKAQGPDAKGLADKFRQRHGTQ